MRREFTTRSAAQSFADEVHDRMIENDKDYAARVESGQTTAWAIPYQELDENEKPLSSSWYVNLKDRCLKVLTTQERSSIKAYRGRTDSPS